MQDSQRRETPTGRPPIIALTTDFGERDGYVGVMKGVIAGLAPDARLIDLSHAIGPGDLAGAAFVLYASYRYFPPDTIHLVVVDPGVGSERRPLALHTPRGLFVGPDNGVFGYILEAEPAAMAYHLTDRRFWLAETSRTFHGRDIFAPVAGHLAAGVAIQTLGAPIADPVRRPFPPVVVQDEAHLLATVIHTDHFGNLITNLPATQLPAGRRVAARLGERIVFGLCATYSDAPAGAPLLLAGYSGFIEIAVNQGNAAQALGVSNGEPVVFITMP